MKVDYDLYFKDSGSVNKGHYVESNESVSISLSHDYTTAHLNSVLMFFMQMYWRTPLHFSLYKKSVTEAGFRVFI